MSKKRRKSGGLQDSSPRNTSPRVDAGHARVGRAPLSLFGWRRALLRFGLVLGLPLLLAALELGLRLGGYGHPTAFFVRLEGTDDLVTNSRFTRRFMAREVATQPPPVRMKARKAPGVLRIFVLGESAAQGTPAPAFGFSRILEVMLQERYPEQRFEMVNAALRGINSHAILPIARECAGHSPDLFLIYMGNNETVGLYCPKPGQFSLTPYRRIIQASQWAKSTRLAQLLQRTAQALGRHAAVQPKQDMDFFRRHRLAADDPARQAVYDNFRANLDAISRVTRASGARVILSTMAGNLKEFPPLASLHRPGLTAPELARWEAAVAQGAEAEARGQLADASARYLEAARLDDHFAELHFRLGRCHLAAGQAEPARRHFKLARDWDALQFRTDGRMNDSLREIAASRRDPGLTLLDAEQIFADSSEDGLPGNRLFKEHVHFTFDGDYLLARSFLPAAARALGLPGGAEAAPRPVPTRERCADTLAFTEWDEISVTAAAARMTAEPPFLDQLDHAALQARSEQAWQARSRLFQQQGGFRPAQEIYRAALGRRPHDWQILFNFANLLSDSGDPVGAAAQFTRAVQEMPVFLPMRVALAQSLWKSGQRTEAVAALREAVRLDPEFAAARKALAQVTGQTRP